jgi:hypothetical protein
MKKIMIAAFALSMLGGVAFAQAKPAITPKQETKKEVKAHPAKHQHQMKKSHKTHETKAKATKETAK